ncbi:ABC transporter permease [Amycolatopsis nigrescens]|uniref:ABC transporter permease n=1 Tax=Amycolatopsis nigrescens TaxID=381445 RepID=UPI00035E1AC7|nr:ABC transporter permease [Amycolatopsis nigrescens]
MTLLATERIKLFTTRSPWWCALIALAVMVGFGALIAGTSEGGGDLSVATSQFGYQFGLPVVMVLAALAVTTEYRFGTIRTTFQAVPARGRMLLAKTTVVAVLALVIGELSAFGSLGVAALIKPAGDFALNSSADWINVAGVGAVYALSAVVAVAVGILIRHSAGAIALLLIYSLVVESLVPMIPNVGDDIYKWMPFNVANKFLTGDGASRGIEMAGPPLSTATLSQWGSLAFFAGFAALMLIIAISTAKKRDA